MDKLDTPGMSQLLTSGLAAFTSLALATAGFLRSRTRKRKLTTVDDDDARVHTPFEAALRATSALSDLRRAHKADHAVIMAVHGDRLADWGDGLFTSVVYEDSGDGAFPETMDRWQRMPLDAMYREILIETFRHGSAFRSPDDLPVDSALVNAWRAYGVARVYWVGLAEPEAVRYFAALSWHLENDTVTSRLDTIQQVASLSELRKAVADAVGDRATKALKR